MIMYENFIAIKDHFNLLLSQFSLIVVFILLTSCSNDENTIPSSPSLSITSGTNDINGTTVVVNPGERLTFTIIGTEGNINLQTLSFRIDGVEIPVERFTIDGDMPSSTDIVITGNRRNVFTNVITLNASTTDIENLPISETVTLFVVDDNGETASVEFILSTEEPPVDLTPSEDFSFIRVDSANGTGLETFGLLWLSNNAEGMAVIIPDDSVTLVQLPDDAVATITTVEALDEAIETEIENGDTLTEYIGVSSVMDATYTDVLGVENKGIYFLISIANATVVADTVTINGSFRSTPVE